MNLVRLAVLALSDSSEEEWNWKTETNGVEVNTQRIGEAKGPVQVLITAEVPVTSPLSRTNSGHIEIDAKALRRCEGAIEEVADLAAIARRAGRRLSSPSPEVAFSEVMEEERSWLDASSGIYRPGEYRGSLRWQIDLAGGVLGHLSDRPDGVVLLAEALSIDHATARFRELLRIFERSFRLSPYRLVEPVADFLTFFDVFQYDKAETKHWFVHLRDRATHADKRADFALARDVEPVLRRVELAAYDVLFNKKNWRCSDSERRDVWTPEGGVLPDGSTILRRNARAPFEAELLDGFGAFPLNLAARLNGPYPAGWWVDAPQTERRAGRLEIVESLRS